MKFLLLLATAVLLPAQSNPSWWKYVPPDSASVAGMQWKALQMSPFESAVSAELAPGGSFGLPDLALLRSPEQLLVASPSMLVIEYGSFPLAELRAQAAAKGLTRSSLKGSELWLSPEPGVSSVAHVSEKLVLIGSRKHLEDALSRPTYSPLLARAARYSKEDLWVVSARLPDPLASLFVPLEFEATAFEGSVSFWDGLHLVASIERPTPLKALDFADTLAESLASRPALSEATEITTRERSVLLRMDLDEMQLAASLRREPRELVAISAPAKPQPRPFVPPAAGVAAVSTVSPKVNAAIPDLAASELVPAWTPRTQLPPPPARTIKIIGLDSGPREIPLGK